MGEKKEVDNKKNEGEKKSDGGGGQNTVVLKFDMHCEGCAKKVRKSIKKSNGVESVKADSATGKLTVVGNVDPVKIKEKVEEKMKKKVELVSMQPNKPSTNKEGGNGGGGEKKSDEKKSDEKKSEVKPDDKKSEDKKEAKVEKPKEPQVATALLKTRVHCEGCAQKIKKIVGKCDGVQDVNVDLQKDIITVKGTMDMKDLLPYLNVKLKRNVELVLAKKDEGAGGDKKPKEGGGGGGGGGGSKDKPKEGGSTEKPKEGGGGGGSSEKPAKGGGDKKEGAGEKEEGGQGNASNENVTKIEVNKMEYNPYAYGYGAHAYTFDPRQQGQTSYSHQVVDYWHEPEFSNPPQMFSDENPNACSVM